MLSYIILTLFLSEDTLALPGYSGAQTEPEPPQPIDKSASAWRRWDLVREGGTGAQMSGLAEAHLFLAIEFVSLELRNLQ